ncbi:MAG: glycosyltransferase family 4 protein [Candidatus Acidiferrales bacterium]
MNRRLRVLVVCTHPAQYATPVFRLLAKDPRVEFQVAYCSLDGAEPYLDPDFGVEVKWDVALLDGYSWIAMENRSPVRKPGSFFRLFNPDVWRLIRTGRFDAVVLHTGYVCATFWIAMLAAKLSRAGVLFGTDAHDLSPQDQKRWKFWVKKLLWPALFRCADVVIVPSSGGSTLMAALGIRQGRVVVTPFSVDNDWWTEQSRRVDRAAVRHRFGIPNDAIVVLYSAKLQPWKRPADLLRAFARVSCSSSYLIFAGEGPLRATLESEARQLGISTRVRFLGFVNQSVLPGIYTASDVLVLPSEYEPFGVVVNEAMLCGCCAVVSDRVGARFDLVSDGETGFVFRAGDVDSLAGILERIASGSEDMKRLRTAAHIRIKDWSPSANVERLIEAIQMCK